MSLIHHWKSRYPRGSSKGRLIFYVILLVLVILFMTRVEEVMGAFSRVFLQPGQEQVDE